MVFNNNESKIKPITQLTEEKYLFKSNKIAFIRHKKINILWFIFLFSINKRQFYYIVV